MARELTRRLSFGRAPHGAARLAVAWVAVFGLYLHLLAAALCTGAPIVGPAGATPICASAQTGTPGAPRDHDRAPVAPCPYCTAHAHVAAPPTPAVLPASRLALVLVAPTPPRPRAGTSARVRASASPRGPPVG